MRDNRHTLTTEERDVIDEGLTFLAERDYPEAAELLRRIVKDACPTFQPNWASPPGDTLREIMEAEGLNVPKFAVRIGIMPETLSYLLEGRLIIDDWLAEKLANVRGSKAFWLERERLYRRDKARLERPLLRVGVAALLWRSGKVLMHQRQGSHGAGTWSFPGGHLDDEESPREALSREVAEETGLRIEPKMFTPTTYTADVFEVEGKRYITLYLKAPCPTEIGEPVVMEPDKCVEWRWVTPGEWPGELFLPIKNLLAQQGDLRG